MTLEFLILHTVLNYKFSTLIILRKKKIRWNEIEDPTSIGLPDCIHTKQVACLEQTFRCFCYFIHQTSFILCSTKTFNCATVAVSAEIFFSRRKSHLFVIIQNQSLFVLVIYYCIFSKFFRFIKSTTKNPIKRFILFSFYVKINIQKFLFFVAFLHKTTSIRHI